MAWVWMSAWVAINNRPVVILALAASCAGSTSQRIDGFFVGSSSQHYRRGSESTIEDERIEKTVQLRRSKTTFKEEGVEPRLPAGGAEITHLRHTVLDT